MSGTFRLIRLFGIDIQIHFSWVLIFLLVAWTIASNFLPDQYPELSRGTRWVIGIVGSALLFASVLVHELAHSLVAVSRGHQVHSITLFFLGGVSNIADEASSAGEEFVISVVGPLSSLVLFGVFLGLFFVAPAGSAFRAISHYLWIVNAGVAVFNMIPAFPLDGGRVLKAIVWRTTGSEARATTVSSVTGSVFGFAMIALGIFFAFNGNLIWGLWFIFIGWFIQSAAGSVRRQEVVETALSGKTVRDALREGDFPVIQPGTTIQSLIENHIMRDFERAYIVQHGDTFQGLITLNDVKQVPQEKWASAWVTEAMTRAENVVTVRPGDSLEDALQTLASRGFHQLVVMDNGRPIGLLTRGDVLRVFEIADFLQARRASADSRR
ncbi:MAG: site-2 protease family protein [Chloroflexi bacterium]|nr:site-2 protease family protein [Chloroflexota bacterium]